MTIKQHPDYLEENDRLLFTTAYIDLILQSRENQGGDMKERMQNAMADLDFSESSAGYQDMLLNATFMHLNEQQYRHLKAVRGKPYFARMDFLRDRDQNPEKIYIGKTSLYDRETQDQIIVDWRSPIANLYYEGRLGEVSYEAEEKMHHGELVLKRQYMIEEGHLNDFRDIDITTKDDLLQESLSQSASSRLTDIVATIQEEQNQVIRADMRRPLIVQGVAGSGKTTIALHRVSFYIYSATSFIPENLMILAPNRLFIEYISEVLPELGVESVWQTTFIDFFYDSTGLKIKLIPLHHDLKTLIEAQDSNETQTIRLLSKIKSSLSFKDMLIGYLKDIETHMISEEHFRVGRFIIYKASKIKRLFQVEYAYLPFYQRLEKIKRILREQLKAKKKLIVRDIQKRYDDRIEQVRFHSKDPQKRHERILKLMDKQEALIKEVEHDAKTAIKTYMAQYKKQNALSLYKELMADPDKLVSFCQDNQIDRQTLELLSKETMRNLKKRRVTIEDLAPIILIQHDVLGLKTKQEIKHVVIDEAQDYSPFQFYTLRHVLGTSLFTILGDLSQGIFSFRGTTNWEEIQKEIFPKANIRLLKQSYRTTVEIMTLANEVIRLANIPGTIKAVPVVRHGLKPYFHKLKDQQSLIKDLEKTVDNMRNEGLKTFAMIGKTEQACGHIKQLLDEASNLQTTLLKEDEDLREKDVVIVPSALAKGLEFDGVILINMGESYKKEDIEIKLLYVAMTRPLHQLHLFSEDPSSFLLESDASLQMIENLN
ncbi:AAA family ATPase [Terrilactibacillus sp. BCM23-1]|uniref:AAA family ATPase n=1 Tax=Terrilactibacillus tamarindi TaxID=2599694 RepID=A0A6N8CNP2_9BACI|nr:RNA polymerase recycling motor HelD [Terrilactibacillus tamarindi]MTT30455.1 AAA family ATPase [Terrilactibacillus tamarindi]